MSVSTELISIIIPCYNYGRYLGDAIESALNQSYQPIEVIVVDDGSTDNTPDVAARYPVKLLSQPHRGVCAATNAGMAASHGGFMMRLDADDALAPAYAAEMLAALAEDPEADFAYSDGAYFGEAIGSFPIREFDVDALAEGAYVTSLALMRRSSFERVGGYDLALTGLRCEDWDLWLTFAEHHMRGVRVPKTLWYYRQHGRASRNARYFLSVRGMRRELALVAHLQDKHPGLFAVEILLKRLQRLPQRLWCGEVSVRFALLLVSFYGVMLMRRALGLGAAGRARS